MKTGPDLLRGRLFYGWVIVASGLLMMLVVDGARYSFGVFFSPLESEFGLSRAMTSGVFAVFMILSPAFAILGGWAADRYGPRAVVAVTGVSTGLSLFLTGRVDYAWQLFLTYSVLLALGTGAVYVALMTASSHWFVKRRAAAMGIIGSGSGLGTLVMAPVAAQLITTFDWRVGFLGLAIIAWVLMVPLSLLLKKDPAQIGAMPDGRRLSPADGGGAAANDEPVQFSLVEALKTRSFWLLVVVYFCYGFSIHLVMTHVVPRAQDLGISAVQAATIVSVVGGVSVPSRALLGMASDRLGKRKVAAFCALLQAAAMVWLIGCTDAWMFYLFAVVYGIGYGGIDAPLVAMIGDIFGLRRVGVILGSVVTGWGLGAAVGPYVGGVVFDLSGSYSIAFLVTGLLMIVGAVSVSWLGAPRRGAVSRC